MYFSLSAILQTSFCKLDSGIKFQEEGPGIFSKMLMFFDKYRRFFEFAFLVLNDAVFLQRPGGARVAELVIDADASDRGGQFLTQQAAHRFAQAADDGMLLAGDDFPALLCGGKHQFLVQWLDRGHVDDHIVNSLLGQDFARFNPDHNRRSYRVYADSAYPVAPAAWTGYQKSKPQCGMP